MLIPASLSSTPTAPGIGRPSPSRALPEDWPFQVVYLWDAPTRLTPLLLLGALAGAWASALFAPGQSLHRALIAALPGLALFHLLWPLYGPRRAQVRARLRTVGWRASWARWAPRALGPGRTGLAARLVLLLLVLGAAATAESAAVRHQGLALAALGLMTLQGLGILWQHRRAGEALWPALRYGLGTGRPDEALPGRARGWAWALALLIPTCWLGQMFQS